MGSGRERRARVPRRIPVAVIPVKTGQRRQDAEADIRRRRMARSAGAGCNPFCYRRNPGQQGFRFSPEWRWCGHRYDDFRGCGDGNACGNFRGIDNLTDAIDFNGCHDFKRCDDFTGPSTARIA
jgi:hypothetical protein